MQANKALLLSNMLSSTNSVENADIAKFEASCVTPLDITVDIDPVQDLHGYDNPWPVGGGVNKANLEGATNSTQHTLPLVTSFDTDSEIITISGKITPSIAYLQYRFAVFPNIQNGLGLKAFNISSGAYADTLSWDGTTQTVVIIVRGLTAGQENDVNIKFHLFAYEGSTTPSSWTPYSNICPISGWTGAKVTRTGENLFDKSKATVGKFINDALQEVINIGKAHSELIPVKPSTTYFMNGFGGSGFYAMLAVDGDMKRIAWYGGASKSEPFTATTPSNCHYIYLNFNADQIDTMAFYEGNTNKGYIPFDGQTISIPFSTSVYGGKLNVETGELVVTHQMVDMGTLTWSGNQRFTATVSDSLKTVNGGTIPNWACSSLKVATPNAVYANTVDYAVSFYGVNLIQARANSITDATSFKAAMNGVQLVYELANPATLTLTPVELRSLLGDNNVWSDTGNVSVRNITCNADVLELLLKTKLIGEY